MIESSTALRFIVADLDVKYEINYFGRYSYYGRVAELDPHQFYFETPSKKASKYEVHTHISYHVGFLKVNVFLTRMFL